ncbi:MAG TPA: hypothetical protein VFY38_00255, partial [Pseudonocardia sp.]|nr:hypothetical protein [Pseudonocardia sp.]
TPPVPALVGRAAPGRWVAGPVLRGRLCAVYLPAGHRRSHAWSGGRPGVSYGDPAGPRAATLMWRSLGRHRRR